MFLRNKNNGQYVSSIELLPNGSYRIKLSKKRIDAKKIKGERHINALVKSGQYMLDIDSESMLICDIVYIRDGVKLKHTFKNPVKLNRVQNIFSFAPQLAENGDMEG